MEIVIPLMFFVAAFYIAFFHEYDADGTIQNNKRARRRRNRESRKQRDRF